MSKKLYDKNEYENYPSYLMGKKKEKKTIPSPMKAFANQQPLLGGSAWKHDENAVEEKEEVNNASSAFSNCKIREYNFDNYGGGSFAGEFLNLLSGFKSGTVEGMGVKMSLKIKGQSKIIKDNILKISIDVLSRPDLKVNASVMLIQDGITKQNLKFDYPIDGYIHEPHILPLGDAYIELPFSGAYEVKVKVGCVHTAASGRGANSYSFDLPYSM